MTHNPLLVAPDQPVAYGDIRPEHIVPAISQLLEQARAAVEQAADPALTPDWDSIVAPLDNATEPLWRAWSVAGHLNAVVNTPALREAYNEALPLVTEFSTWVGLHTGLYRQYKALAAAPAFATLSPLRQRIIELGLRDFRLSGVELQGQDREDFATISEREAQVTQKFSENVLDAIDDWSLHITDTARLDGIPEDVLEAARAAAEQDGQSGWKLTLKMPCYLPVMQYATNRDLRATLYRAYGTAASDQGDARFDNSALIEELLELRSREAGLLGYSHFAELRLLTRMADNATQVTDFLRDLARRARPHAEQDLATLRAFARDELGLDTLQPWDTAFVSERLREARYAYSEDEVKQYFSAPRVLQGLFDIAAQLFRIRLREIEASAWHADVRCVQVEDESGTLLGHLYIDLYARTGKQSGAWVDSERNRRRHADGTLQTPIAYLCCNFSAPGAGQPALLTHDDVITLFHESGHALHALLGEIDEPGASAFAAVEWDAIELPSQFMENFCWEWPVLERLSGHHASGEPLPHALYERMLAARNYQSGLQMVRQIEFSLFDMLLHQRTGQTDIAAVLALLQEVRQEVAVLFPPEWHRQPHTFSHLFAGGYGAGYYSYKWAEVLSADAYAAFEEAVQAGKASSTLEAAEVGLRFRREILAVGGARPAAESFQAFRGRDPEIQALLRHQGMLAD